MLARAEPGAAASPYWGHGALGRVAAGLGWQDAQTYIQSGNLVFAGAGAARGLAAALDRAVGASVTFRNLKTLRAVLAMQ